MRMTLTFKAGTIMGLVAAAATALAAGPDTFANGKSFYGSPGAEGTGGRVIEVGTVRRLNVAYGETVTFRSQGRQFTWTFDGLDQRAVDFSKIAPSGFAAPQPLTIYVPLDPLTRN